MPVVWLATDGLILLRHILAPLFNGVSVAA